MIGRERRATRRSLRFAAIAAAAVALVSSLMVAGGAPAASVAVTPDTFNPGYIISDSNFFNGSALSEAEVQYQLNVVSRGCASGYTCLKDFRQDTWSRSADAMCAAYQGGSSESAARIIAKVGAACGISQRVLLVLLEKEQSLLSSTAPSQSRYDRATGYACPDTAPCDAEFLGFYNQVYKAAWQYKRYSNPPGTSRTFTWYPVGQTSNIAFNPNSGCGSAPVKITNQATANLYYYTPYQPNQAALNNMYGTGDDCSAYGNRNFWRIYKDWFGSPTDGGMGDYGTAEGGYGGIHITGWAADPTHTGTTYVWVNVDGVGTPYAANKPLAWFDALFPGYGSNHGFDEVISRPPGTYQVCVTNTANEVLLGCKQVTVPVGAGSFGNATAGDGSLTVEGWAVSYASTAPVDIQVSVNGQSTTYKADKNVPWINAYFPGIGENHGFEIKIMKPKGTYQVCVTAPSGSLGCKSVTVVRHEVGVINAAEGVAAGIRVDGWSVDLTTKNPSYVWVSVDGKSVGPQIANRELDWFEALYAGAGTAHGFDFVVPQSPGAHTICIVGTASGADYGCKTVTVPSSEVGSYFSADGVQGGIRSQGWSVDLTTKNPSYVWVSVDGRSVGPQIASGELNWFEAMFPGAGTAHQFDFVTALSPGQHRVCIVGTAKGTDYGCKTATVPSPEAGSFYAADAVANGARIRGWTVDLTTKNPSYVWVSVDGKSVGPQIANGELPWFEAMFPGAGTAHEFDFVLPLPAGQHQVCLVGTAAGTNYGCKSVVVG
jgi:hypothetical protein